MPAFGRQLHQQRKSQDDQRENNAKNPQGWSCCVGVNQLVGEWSCYQGRKPKSHNRQAHSEAFLVWKPSGNNKDWNTVDNAHASSSNHSVGENKHPDLVGKA